MLFIFFTFMFDISRSGKNFQKWLQLKLVSSES